MEKSRLKLLALIPARGSSKSIKFKNLVKIKNVSLLERNFKVIKNSRVTKHIFCSTENKKIADACFKMGLEVIKRPISLSKDNTNIFYVAKHAVDFLKKKNLFFDYIILLQPTYPFVSKSDIVNSIKKLRNSNITSCQTVHLTPHSYHYLNTRIIKNDYVKFKFIDERRKKFNKQKKEKTYNFGNLVITKTKTLLNEKTFFTKKSTFLVIDRYRSFDLDNKYDLDYLKNFR
jgi:CMP-N-acetylneuraminic acid synthetase